jgi:hypothetical protein
MTEVVTDMAFIKRNHESPHDAANHPARKRVLVLLAWYATDVFRGIPRSSWVGRKLKSMPKPVGILAEIDDYAIKVIGAAEDARLSIPEKVAVLGVGNDELRCPFAQVPLSSVNDNAYGIGQQACILLERLMADPSAAVAAITVQPLGIVTRHSTDSFRLRRSKIQRKALRPPLTREGRIVQARECAGG